MWRLNTFIKLSIFTGITFSRIIVLKTNETFADRIAAFGGRMEEYVDGYLVPVEQLELDFDVKDRDEIGNIADKTTAFVNSPALQKQEGVEKFLSSLPQQGCERRKPPQLNRHDDNWIALVQRGGCSFIDKVRAMQASGAAAVVVGDNERTNALITMYAAGDTSDVHIPSVFIKQVSYMELQFMLKPSRLSVESSPYDNASESFLPIRMIRSDEFQWPLLDIIIVTVIAPIVVVVFLYSLWRFRRRRLAVLENQENPERPEVLSQEELSRIPIIVYSTSDKYSKDWDTCAICLDEFEEGDELRALHSCRHRFHVKCIDVWLGSRQGIFSF
jgi:hypothetical protein